MHNIFCHIYFTFQRKILFANVLLVNWVYKKCRKALVLKHISFVWHKSTFFPNKTETTIILERTTKVLLMFRQKFCSYIFRTTAFTYWSAADVHSIVEKFWWVLLPLPGTMLVLVNWKAGSKVVNHTRTMLYYY